MSLQAWDLACDSLCLPLLPHSQEAACPSQVLPLPQGGNRTVKMK